MFSFLLFFAFLFLPAFIIYYLLFYFKPLHEATKKTKHMSRTQLLYHGPSGSLLTLRW